MKFTANFDPKEQEAFERDVFLAGIMELVKASDYKAAMVLTLEAKLLLPVYEIFTDIGDSLTVLTASNDYDVLGVTYRDGISERQLVQAYRRSCAKFHPDKHQKSLEMTVVGGEAFRLLLPALERLKKAVAEQRQTSNSNSSPSRPPPSSTTTTTSSTRCHTPSPPPTHFSPSFRYSERFSPSSPHFKTPPSNVTTSSPHTRFSNTFTPYSSFRPSSSPPPTPPPAPTSPPTTPPAATSPAPTYQLQITVTLQFFLGLVLLFLLACTSFLIRG